MNVREMSDFEEMQAFLSDFGRFLYYNSHFLRSPLGEHGLSEFQPKLNRVAPATGRNQGGERAASGGAGKLVNAITQRW
jgi:hypothetical protein